jgi:hypothetical protein
MQRNTHRAWRFIAIFAVLGITQEDTRAIPSASSDDGELQTTEQRADKSKRVNGSQQEKDTSKKADARPRSTNNRPDFNPSEKISEDFSVSFPVDI